MNVSMPDLIRKAARKAGMIARRGRGPVTPIKEMHDPWDAYDEKYGPLGPGGDYFLEIHGLDQRGAPKSVLSDDGQLELDVSYDQDQRDLFAEVAYE